MRTALEDAHRELDAAVVALTLLVPRLHGNEISLAMAQEIGRALERLDWHLAWAHQELTYPPPEVTP